MTYIKVINNNNVIKLSVFEMSCNFFLQNPYSDFAEFYFGNALETEIS